MICSLIQPPVSHWQQRSSHNGIPPRAGEIGSGRLGTAFYELVPADPDNPNDPNSTSNHDLASDFVRTELKPSATDSDVVLNVHFALQASQRIDQPVGHDFAANSIRSTS